MRATQAGSYQPRRDATGWVEFCLEAHIAQAQRRLTQIELAAARWQRLEALAEERNWPGRLVIALEQSLIGGADRRRYAEEADISAPTASADFRRLLDAGLVDQRGRGRSTSYAASNVLREKVGLREEKDTAAWRAQWRKAVRETAGTATHLEPGPST